MDLEKVRNYCLSFKGTTESFPFGEETLVFKVKNKMFCLTNLYPPHRINLKCEPEKAIEFREQYQAVHPGYHMNKKHWNTIDLDGSIKSEVIMEWIKNSYDLAVKNLSKKEREKLGE